MSKIIALASDAGYGGSRRRLDWHLINRVARHPGIQELLGQTLSSDKKQRALHDDLGFDLSGFDFLNLDGLVLLLSVSEALTRSGLPPTIALPNHAGQQADLINNGFIRAARTIARLHGPRLLDWDIGEETAFVLGRPYVTRFSTSRELTGVQEKLDRFLLSSALLKRIGIDPTSEDGWEWAPALAHAVNELLKNVLEWSGAESGFIGLESIPGSVIRLIVADSGVGVEHSLSAQRSPILGLDPLKFALLYRYFYHEEPGLFTVLQTTKRWGGEFFIRSGQWQITMNLPSGLISNEALVALVNAEKARRVPYLPGLQVRVDFQIHNIASRRR